MGSPTTSSKSRTGRHLPDFEQRAQESKVRVEDDVAAIADESFSPVFLRNATAFGFSPRLRADIVLNNLVGHAVLTGDVRVLSDGTPWRPLVHARDIATAFLAALEAPIHKVHCAAYNVGTESNNLVARHGDGTGLSWV